MVPHRLPAASPSHAPMSQGPNLGSDFGNKIYVWGMGNGVAAGSESGGLTPSVTHRGEENKVGGGGARGGAKGGGGVFGIAL